MSDSVDTRIEIRLSWSVRNNSNATSLLGEEKRDSARGAVAKDDVISAAS